MDENKTKRMLQHLYQGGQYQSRYVEKDERGRFNEHNSYVGWTSWDSDPVLLIETDYDCVEMYLSPSANVNTYMRIIKVMEQLLKNPVTHICKDKVSGQMYLLLYDTSY